MVAVHIEVEVFDDPVGDVDFLDDLHAQTLQLGEGLDQLIVPPVGAVAAQDSGEMAGEACQFRLKPTTAVRVNGFRQSGEQARTIGAENSHYQGVIHTLLWGAYLPPVQRDRRMGIKKKRE